MLTIISPAKKIEFKKSKNISEEFYTLPVFTQESEYLISELKKLKVSEISKLMSISPALADLNFERYLKWQIPQKSNAAQNAVFMFQGDVYQGLKANDFSSEQIQFMQKSLLILSGLHGILRPLDLIHPYRLEMGTKLKTLSASNLYEFWGNKISEFINSVISENGYNTLVNLASDEYFKAVNPKIINARIVKPVFKDEKNGQFKIISFYAKKARGLMTRFIIQNKIKNPDDLKAFDSEGYSFSPQMSKGANMVFVR